MPTRKRRLMSNLSLKVRKTPFKSAPSIADSARGFRIGDSCEDSCSVVLKNSYCNLTTNTCQCLDTHPIAIEGFACVDGRQTHQRRFSMLLTGDGNSANSGAPCKKGLLTLIPCRCCTTVAATWLVSSYLPYVIVSVWAVLARGKKESSSSLVGMQC